jgi:hypothetical protein
MNSLCIIASQGSIDSYKLNQRFFIDIYIIIYSILFTKFLNFVKLPERGKYAVWFILMTIRLTILILVLNFLILEFKPIIKQIKSQERAAKHEEICFEMIMCFILKIAFIFACFFTILILLAIYLLNPFNPMIYTSPVLWLIGVFAWLVCVAIFLP